MACDEYTQKLCVAIIQRLSAISQTAGLLYRNVSLLPWLMCLLDQAKNRVIVYAVMVVIEHLSVIQQEEEALFESNLLLALPRLLEGASAWEARRIPRRCESCVSALCGDV